MSSDGTVVSGGIPKTWRARVFVTTSDQRLRLPRDLIGSATAGVVAAIAWVAVAAGLPQLPDTALVDILLRRPPRTRSGAPLPRSTDAVIDITTAVLDLDSSYLAVHGPPGTGKTHTAAQVITQLATDHAWRIGVVAQSHATVENLLECVIDAGLDPGRVAKKPHDHNAPRSSPIPPDA